MLTLNERTTYLMKLRLGRSLAKGDFFSKLWPHTCRWSLILRFGPKSFSIKQRNRKNFGFVKRLESDTLWHVSFSFADGFHKPKIGRRKHRDLSTVASQQEASTLNLCQEKNRVFAFSRFRYLPTGQQHHRRDVLAYFSLFMPVKLMTAD